MTKVLKATRKVDDRALATAVALLPPIEIMNGALPLAVPFPCCDYLCMQCTYMHNITLHMHMCTHLCIYYIDTLVYTHV